MKTSNIIIIVFSVFVVSSMLTFFIDSKNHPNNNSNNRYLYNEFNLQNHSITEFSVLVAEAGTDIHIEQTDSNKISIECPKGEKTQKNFYTLSNDTLFINGKFRTWIKCKKLNQVISHDHKWLGIDVMSKDSLLLNINGGITYLQKNNPANIQFFKLIANNDSYVDIANLSIDNFYVTCKNKSEIKANGLYKNVNSLIENNSKLNLSKNPLELTMKKDSTSQFKCLR